MVETVQLGVNEVEALRLTEHLFVEVEDFRGRPQALLSLWYPNRYDTQDEYDLAAWKRTTKLGLWKGDIAALLAHAEDIKDFLQARLGAMGERVRKGA